MKKKVLSALLSAAMVATLLVGCGGSNQPAPADTAAPADTQEAAPADTQAAAPAEGSMHFEIVSKGFQHQYWQAVYKGAQNKSKELGVIMNFVGPNSESDIADQVQILNNAINANPVLLV